MKSRARLRLAIAAVVALGTVLPIVAFMARGEERSGRVEREVAASVEATPSAPETSSSTPPAPKIVSSAKKPKANASPKREPACVAAMGEEETPPEASQDGSDASPHNERATITVCVNDTTPAPGEVITVTVIGDDPDAVIVDEECGWEVWWGDEGVGYATLCRDFLVQSEDPPIYEPEPGHIERSATHRYAKPGRYTITGYIWSGDYEGYPNPYSSRVSAELTVTVA